MNDLDPRLAELLRRRPAPTALDAAHRDAIRAAARQAWFRQQTRRRRQGIALAAAACLAAGLAGWALHAGLDAPQVAAAPVVAIHEQTPQRQRLNTDEAVATTEERAIDPAAMAAKPAMPMTAQPMAPAATGFAAAEMQAANLTEADAAPADMAAEVAEAPQVAAKSAMHARRALPSADALAAAPLADRHEDAELITIPADAPQRGRLLAAAAVLDAVEKHRLADADRSPALQAALDSLAGLKHPAADQLRRRIVQALQTP